MYCVIQTKGVDEPWWMMDDWKEMIVLEESCSTIEEAKKLYQELLEKYKKLQKSTIDLCQDWLDKLNSGAKVKEL